MGRNCYGLKVPVTSGRTQQVKPQIQLQCYPVYPLIFINDLLHNTRSSVHLFADGCVLYIETYIQFRTV